MAALSGPLPVASLRKSEVRPASPWAAQNSVVASSSASRFRCHDSQASTVWMRMVSVMGEGSAFARCCCCSMSATKAARALGSHAQVLVLALAAAERSSGVWVVTGIGRKAAALTLENDAKSLVAHPCWPLVAAVHAC